MTTLDEWSAMLAAAYAERNNIIDRYNRMPVPSLEELCTALRDNRWLCEIVERAAMQRYMLNHGGLPVRNDMHYGSYGKRLEYNQLVAVVPFLRRMGYSVMICSFENKGNPFNLGFPGRSLFRLSRLKAAMEEYVNEGCTYNVYLHGTAPAQVRQRGMLKCVPRLLGWLRAARIALANPSRPGAMEALTQERDAALDATDPPHWETKADVQAKRKRSIVDALHANDHDVADGARWFNIQERGKRARCHPNGGAAGVYSPMRIEAVAGDHFVFQDNHGAGDNWTFKVVVVHRDAFDVDTWPENCNAAGCEFLFDKRFRDRPLTSEDGSDSEYSS